MVFHRQACCFQLLDQSPKLPGHNILYRKADLPRLLVLSDQAYRRNGDSLRLMERGLGIPFSPRGEKGIPRPRSIRRRLSPFLRYA